ncbi:MAG: hypothetical protein LQ344_000768 [Seirophora lacunosa]|nr:MAG: hypothetical protein LQ344_000768 [Seirophora lacunosa]
MPTLLRGRDTGQSSAPSGFIVVAIAVPAIFLVFATFSCLLAYTRRKRWRQPYPAGGAPLHRQQWGGGDDGPERPPPYSGPVGVRMPERVYEERERLTPPVRYISYWRATRRHILKKETLLLASLHPDDAEKDGKMCENLDDDRLLALSKTKMAITTAAYIQPFALKEQRMHSYLRTTSDAGIFIFRFVPLNPRPMLQSLVNEPVTIRLKWGATEYTGRLVSVDSYMNVQLAGTEEFVDGKSTGMLGQVLIRYRSPVLPHPCCCSSPLLNKEERERGNEANAKSKRLGVTTSSGSRALGAT